MNSLEFIENQIKEIDKQLDYYKRKIDEDSMFKSFIESYTSTIKDLTNLKNTFLQIKTELEEYKKLKDKETPKKVVRKWREGYDPKLYYPKSFHCPTCSRHLRSNQSYKCCPKCGQKLNWSDEDE